MIITKCDIVHRYPITVEAGWKGMRTIMCGITGWVEWKKNLTQFPSILEAMTDTLAPRGPDASGTWMTAHCAFGHRRLSVIDPENGAQPMYREVEGTTFCIVYNGELYNAAELRATTQRQGTPLRHEL